MISPALKILEPVLHAEGAEGLSRFLADLETTFAAFARAKQGYLSPLADYVLTGSGKRVRPALVYVASRFGAADPAAVRETAAAVEMIHIATLVHDDLVDDAVLRRGRPTVGVKFGEGAAVLLGDHVYAQAFQRLGLLGDAELIRLFADTTMVMCEGEIGQYESRYQFDLSEEAYLAFLQKKTASLMSAACRAGARLAGLPAAAAGALEIFGDRLGVAFQVIDDILDVEGDETVVGKTLHTDLTHGKMTLPLILHAARLSPADRAVFIDALKNPGDGVDGLIRRIRSSGVLAECRQKVSRLVADAEAALRPLPEGPPKTLLLDIARRLSDRRL